jgi:hypothetical protein
MKKRLRIEDVDKKDSSEKQEQVVTKSEEFERFENLAKKVFAAKNRKDE